MLDAGRPQYWHDHMREPLPRIRMRSGCSIKSWSVTGGRSERRFLAMTEGNSHCGKGQWGDRGSVHWPWRLLCQSALTAWAPSNEAPKANSTLVCCGRIFGVRLRAQDTLDDCRVALQYLEAGRSAADWRVHWVAALALLRAVGHVLKNVDGEASDHARKTIDERWRSWKAFRHDHRIFWEFIENERNYILKQYAFGAEQQENVLALSDGTVPVLSDGSILGLAPQLLMQTGSFEGADGPKLVAQAIDWWDEQLRLIAERLGPHEE